VVRELEAAHTRLAEEVEALWERRLEMERCRMRGMDSQATDSLLHAQETLARQLLTHQQVSIPDRSICTEHVGQ
jgi:phage shock protein A